MIMTKYLDRFANRLQRRPRGREAMDIVAACEESDWEKLLAKRAVPLVCRACGKRAQLELTTDSTDRTEYLCYEDLGPFLELFTHPGIREWTIVRLP